MQLWDGKSLVNARLDLVTASIIKAIANAWEYSFKLMTRAGSRNTYVISSWLFLRLLGSTYFLAFLSAHLQVQGLLGSDGIVPAHNTLQAFAQKSSLAWLQHPSIFWLDSSDWLLTCVTTSGIALSLFIVLDFCTWPALLAAWIFYLSLHSVGSVFFAFQWDTLLLEATLPAFFLPLTMPSLRAPARSISPFASALVFIYRWLLFRVMFCSGLVKLAKGCLVWSNMTALAYYYETQLLPSPLALWAHHLPLWFQVACTAGTFVIELGVPFLIFAGRWARLVAAASFLLLMALIGLAGNHGYFNYLCSIICLFLIDDQVWLSLLKLPSFVREPIEQSVPPQAPWQNKKVCAVAALVFFLTLLPVLARFDQVVMPRPLLAAVRVLGRWGIAGNYGLYDTIFTRRAELVFEGSNDLEHWQAIKCRYKIQELEQPPPFLLLIQPRLDWRLRFAVLGEPGQSPWLRGLITRLLAGSPTVSALFADNPFKASPPAYLRVMRYTYAFQSPAELAVSGRWWRRFDEEEFIGPTDLD